MLQRDIARDQNIFPVSVAFLVSDAIIVGGLSLFARAGQLARLLLIECASF